jgi:hypothetical protein
MCIFQKVKFPLFRTKLRQLNSIGMSGQDLHFILEGKMSLIDAIRAKLARAGEGRGFMVSVYELILQL